MVTTDVPSPRRRSIRLRDYDYSEAGAYFVTICAQDRRLLFGTVDEAAVRLTACGEIVQAAWESLPARYPHISLDLFVVMPNHVHGIIVLVHPDDLAVEATGLKATPSRRHAVPEIVRAFKTFSARKVNEQRGTPGEPVWQRNYYEHVVRDEKDLRRIQEYILNNPAAWAEDPENPGRMEGP